jgi:hypothetical protein
MNLKSDIEGGILSRVVANFAASEPVTTCLGFVLAALVGAHINYSLLLQGDQTQIANIISVPIIALLGWFTNHKALKP